jgi:hypothetical protein
MSANTRDCVNPVFITENKRTGGWNPAFLPYRNVVKPPNLYFAGLACNDSRERQPRHSDRRQSKCSPAGQQRRSAQKIAASDRLRFS